MHTIFCGFPHQLYRNILNFRFDLYLFLLTIDVLEKM